MDMASSCVIKDPKTLDTCGKPEHSNVDIGYRFDKTGTKFEFKMAVCRDHFNALCLKLESGELSPFAIRPYF